MNEEVNLKAIISAVSEGITAPILKWHEQSIEHENAILSVLLQEKEIERQEQQDRFQHEEKMAQIEVLNNWVKVVGVCAEKGIPFPATPRALPELTVDYYE